MPDLLAIYRGWDGFQQSLVEAVAPLGAEELGHRPGEGRRSIGQTAAHIAFNRIEWWRRCGEPGGAELAAKAAACWNPDEGASPAVLADAAAIVSWLEESWRMIEDCLRVWTVDDLEHVAHATFDDVTVAITRQWLLWHLLSHDTYHGGQLTLLLADLDIEPPDLAEEGGHITPTPRVG